MTSKSGFKFCGLMAPVFTSFKDDECQTIQVENIEAYADYLKTNGINGVLVNGTTGEGPSLTVAERKFITEKWLIAAKKYHLVLMVQIGGASLSDVIELAKHAEKLSIDAVLCLPELYFKPKTSNNLIKYLKRISQYCETCPFLYYHIPSMTGVDFHMPTFCIAARKEIQNFAGIKFTSNDLSHGSECLEYADNVLIGADTLLSSALILGFKSAILTTINIYPNLCVKIIKSMENDKMKDAHNYQNELNSKIRKILNENNNEWVTGMKKMFNTQKIQTGLDVGATRI